MNDDTSLRAGRREWIGLAVLALPALLVALDIGVLFLALPHLSADLGASGTEQLWITDSYGFLLAGFLITMGSLGDRIGRRRLLLVGAAAFGVASVLAAYSTTPEALIVARGFLGIAGASLGPSTLALISTMFRDGRQRGLAISIWGACQFGGAALGPVIGGVMLSHFWWGSAFLLGVPVMAVLLLAGPALLPEYRAPGAARIDVLSSAMSLLAILPAVWGVKELAAGDGTASLSAVGAIAAGLVVGALFVVRQRRLEQPLIDVSLLSEPSIGGVLGAMALGSAALAGVSLMTSQYVQSVVGLSPAQAGLWQAPTGVGIAAGVLLAPVLVSRLRPASAITVGLSASAAGMAFLARVGGTDELVAVAVSVAVVAFGVGPLFALGTGSVVSSAPPATAGAAASLSETSNVLGSTLGLALLGTIGTAIYRNELADAMPGGVPAAAGEAARETIGGAAAAAADLPAGPAADLVGVAAEAFTRGLNGVAVVGAAAVIGVAIGVRAALRQRGVSTERPATFADNV